MDFSQWYNRVLREADIVDDRFPAKGMYHYPWYGFEAIKRTIGLLEKLLRETGHREERYPMLIPYSVFMKERDFFEGFQGEAYLITRTLKDELEEPLVVRPTSETAMYFMWSLRLRSHRDLPLKVFQTVNIFRCETKMTKPLLRVREVMFFNEAHTAHKDAEGAERQIKEALNVYSRYFQTLKIPYVLIRTPEWDTFPGALYNYDFMTVLPDGKALELGSVINLGTKFAKAFEITVLNERGEKAYVHQTCYGVSERTFGAMVALHGDEKGLAIHPLVAPIQVIVVPIPGVSPEYVDKVVDRLGEFRVEVDWSEKTPGWKYNYWELKGVPVRVEVGPKEEERNTVVLKKRTGGEREEVELGGLALRVGEMLKEVEEDLERRAQEKMAEVLVPAKSLEEVKPGKAYLVGLCEEKECAERVEKETGMEVLGYTEEEGTCVVCGKKAKIALVARKY